MMVVLPVMQLLLFGYAINTDVRHMPTVVYDQDHSAESRDLARSAWRRPASTTCVGAGARLRRDRARAARGRGARRAGRPAALRRATCARGSAAQRAARRRRLRPADGGERDQHRGVAGGRALAASCCSSGSRAPAQRVAVAADRARADHLVQPRAPHRGLRRARARRRDPHDDDGDAHRRWRSRASASAARSSSSSSRRCARVELVVGKILPYIVIGYVQMTLDPAGRAARVRRAARRLAAAALRAGVRCSSRRTWRSACSSRRSPRRSSRRCRCRSSSCCRTSC